MESQVAHMLEMRRRPVAILWTDQEPEKAARFRPGKWGCVMWMLVGASKGKTAAFDEASYGCWGGGVGLGFGNQYQAFPGGEPCFHYFLSIGNRHWETGQAVVKQMEASGAGGSFLEDFRDGEGYLKSPELVADFIEGLPIMRVPTRFVVFKPLEKVDPHQEEPKVVVFWATPHQLAALVVLANYGRPGSENVVVPFGAGCQSVGIYAYRELSRPYPRGVIGQMDLSARLNVRKTMGDHVFTFAAPWKLFCEMEENVAQSFAARSVWRQLVGHP
ncbi:Uncharacterised ArCR, COG2043 [Desulfacinum hydrothermale DSM 13146]|uniref:Uncharacterized ArCR, COG2043 n=1 Tax=Desulfacinum hydrothermale DSM 13146 TaxID=1121390 RepID=A0A1W1XTW1_9BACT|nr:DUF169 domain-containing protein [Desulfacinum hydrothermale]SMC26971.1 Uncharacterised ArCR, COG2043 [Desulfacinum hydrothermale DSM 13146]